MALVIEFSVHKSDALFRILITSVVASILPAEEFASVRGSGLHCGKTTASCS
jgi:hypothetical protein